MRLRRTPAAIAAGGLLAFAMAAAGYLVVEQASDGTCHEQTEQLAQQQAELIDQLGANAPNYDFAFPEACFD